MIDWQDYKYKAFISYSHSDEKWARWLHRSLENYRVPKRLVGRQTDMGKVPTRLAPVFRDREELASATDLGNKLTQALESSAVQIVICSMASAKSHWVNEEIKAFKRLGRSDRIFSLIVDGEPYSTGKPGIEQYECFPPALRFKLGDNGELSDEPAEPIAADARHGKDGKANARVKLLAGIMGLGFDDLRQRELQRRNQRLAIITGSAVVGMVAAIGLATTAVIARNDAERQRIRAEAEAETARQTADFMVSMFQVSDPSEARGNTITVREIMDQGAARIEQELATQPAIQATLMDTMGTVYKSLGLYSEARNLLDGALRQRRELVGDENTDVALTKTHLADVLKLQADYAAAEPLYREALELQRRVLGERSGEAADTLEGLAELYMLQGRFEDAEASLRETLDIRRATLGEEHLDVAKSMEDLGMNFFDQGDFDEAVAMVSDSNAMRKRLLHGSPHPQLADGLNNLALVYWQQGRLQEAEALYSEALAMNRVLYSEFHPTIAANMNNLAMVLHDAGDLKTAESMYREVITARRKTLGQDHPDVALALNNLAFLLYDRSDLTGAIAMQRDTVAMLRRAFPDGHPNLAVSVGTLGSWLTDVEQYREAEPLLQEGLAMATTTLGADHVQIGITETALAKMYLATGRTDEAGTMANSAREVFVSQLPEDHWRIAWATSLQGAVLAQQGAFADAEPLLLAGYAALAAGPGSGSRAVYIELTAKYLADLYRAWGRPAEAKKYLAPRLSRAAQ